MSDILLKSMHFPSLDARYIVGDETMSTEGAAADAKATGDALETKADKTDTYTKAQVDDKVDDAKSELEEAIDDLDERKAEIDGCYEGLTSGMAMGLVTDSIVEDKEPYTYRSLANLNVGRFCKDTLVGGSVVWNQLAKCDRATETLVGITFTNNGDGSITLNGTATARGSRNVDIQTTPAPIGHVFFVLGYKKVGTNQGYLGFSGFAIDRGSGGVWKNTTEYTALSFRIDFNEGDTFNNTKMYPIVVDLTALLTPTIADYIYTLETANAGDGVAWFKKYFPGVYYGYSEPHFEHVQTSGKITVGFNQWDEEWELGILDLNTGANESATNRIRSKNYIPCIPNTVYYIEDPTNNQNFRFCYYTEDKSFISSTGWKGDDTFTTPENAYYFRFYVGGGYGATYNHDICINIHGDRDGEYEAYRKRTYPIEPKVLRGVPKLDASNRLYFDGDVMRHDGSGETRYKEMTLNGSENWTLFTGIGVNQFYINQSDARNVAGQVCMMCDKYPTVNISDRGNGYGVGYTGEGTICFNIDPTQYADVASWKAYLTAHPITVVYLCTPEPFTAEPYQSPMVVDPLGTEEFIDYGVEQGDRDVAIPAGHDSTYPEDLVKKTEKMPSPTGTNGDYVITEVDGKLYLKPYVPAVGLTMTAPTTEGEGE